MKVANDIRMIAKLYEKPCEKLEGKSHGFHIGFHMGM